jgi:DegV family protein with EDD domain
MAKIKIVTDSTCDLAPELARELGIEMVPMLLHVGDKVYRSGVDISNEQIYEYMQSGVHKLSVSSPSPAIFEQLYRTMIGEYDHVFSIHVSNRLSGVYAATVQARAKVPASKTKIDLIDSKSASMGLGMVVLAAAEAARNGAAPYEVERLIHSMIRHTHIVFFVDTMEHLEQSGRLALAGAVLGSMQRIKPLMILDEGEVVPYERTRTRAKAIEGLYTFIEDFPNVKNVTVLYSTTPEDVEKLLEKVEPIFPRERVQIAQFGPGIAIYLGPGAMGAAVFEGLDEA